MVDRSTSGSRVRRAAWAIDALEEARLHASLRGRLFGEAGGLLVAGRYVVRERIGSGGGGTVHRAHDRELDRDVALKLLRTPQHASDDTEHVRARFVAEARTMAQLADPNVVTVYDVGTFGDATFIAMELCEGTDLARWLVVEPRSWREVVAVFRAAGQGLAAAHACDVVHRDFKPSNVLVGPAERVRVADFGLARLHGGAASSERDGTSSDRESSPSRTGEVAGTPAYMAPEQHDGMSPTPAADQYAFCVSLWEALCGQRPFAGSYLELVVAKSKGPPRWPARVHVPRRVRAAVLRGLSTDPRARWPSIRALLDALRPRSRASRIALLTAVVALPGVAAIWPVAERPQCTDGSQRLATAWNDARRDTAARAFATTELPYASATWTRVEADLDAFASAWARVHRDACDAPDVDLAMACLDAAAQRFTAVADELEQADARLVNAADRLLASLPDPDGCASVDDGIPAPSVVEAESVRAIREELARARAQLGAQRRDEALVMLVDLRTRAATLGYEPVMTEIAAVLGRAWAEDGRAADAEAVLAEAVHLGMRWRQWDESRRAAILLVHVVGHDRAQPDRAQQWARTARALIERAGGGAEGEAALAYALGVLEADAGRYAESEALFRQAASIRETSFGERDLEAAGYRGGVANALLEQGRFVEAEAELRQVIAVREQVLGATHPTAAASRGMLGVALREQGRLDDALAEYRVAVERQERALGPDHVELLYTRSGLGTVLFETGDWAGALVEQRHGARIAEQAFGAEHPRVATIRTNIANAALRAGDLDAAEAEYRAVLSIYERALGSEHVDVARARFNLAGVLLERGRPADAEAEYRRVLVDLERALGPDHLDVATVRSNLGNALAELGRLAEAEAELRAVLDLRERMLGPDHASAATTRTSLARVLVDRGHADEALPLLEASLRVQRASATPAEHVAETERELARARVRRARSRTPASP